ncbi:unnamed protein product [Cuscuta epithymum]|uniref:Uncharacterized protein n=1 Tax=Cuscuta epithymum TaxID=186058 RepID=A0AAV0DFP9_9ASTE|nr:unnamed protein product [Cuscuta epithymum]
MAWVDLEHAVVARVTLLALIGEVPSSRDPGFARVRNISLELVVVGLQGIFQEEGLMIRPSPEPPPRMMSGAWIRFLCQFILFNFVLHFWSFFGMNAVVVVFCNFYFKTLTLGEGDEGFALATFGSFRPITGQANHIAPTRVIGSPVSPRVSGWKCFLCRLCPLLNVLFLI